MSNPYDPGYQPYQPPPGGYGQPGPYGAPNPYADTGPRTDGLSIAALVCSLTCCAAPVGIGLGIAGIVRTSGGKRRGRWAAVTGLVLGGVGVVAMVAALVGLVWLGTSIAYEDEVEVGDCFDTTRAFEDNDLWRSDCDEEHDAQAFAVGGFSAEADRDAFGRSPAAFCREQLQEAGAPWSDLADDGDYRVDGSSDALNESSPGRGDSWVCYLERADGEKLDVDLRRSTSGSTGA